MGKKPGRPPRWARRQLIDGIRLRVRTGMPRRDLPAECGPWGGHTTCSAGGSGTAPGIGCSSRCNRNRRGPRGGRPPKFDRQDEATVLVAAVNEWL
ncbi:transposase [Streptomyces sp. IMTB 1903]|uniref:transposase n=1 Tax=Streptomyces sp. IMTB 1903 TaxID=1776680 RepID=UPI001F31A61E|nr:transposase [Streptomyces sp. IMTB 1903]